MISDNEIAALSVRQRRWLELQLARRRSPAAEQIPTAPAADGYPLSFSQQRLWFVDQLESGSPFYNIASSILLSGRLDRPALDRAVAELVSRQSSLRTVFVERDGVPLQKVTEAPETRLPLIDLGALPRHLREPEARRVLERESPRPFELGRGPLFRCHLLRLAEERWVMAWVVHHVVSDLWSFGVLFRELATAYEAFARRRRPRLPDLPVHYHDFAVWQRRRLTDEEMEGQLSYWRRQLAGAPSFLTLPTDRPRPAVQTYRGSYRRFDLDGELQQALESLGQEEKCTLFMVILAAYQVLLGHLTGQDDVVVSAPLGGRERQECQGLIGFFVNTLLFRTDLAGDPTFRELLSRVRSLVLEAYAHQNVSLERLVREMAPRRDLSYNPLFQAGMNFVDEDLMPAARVSDLSFEVFEAEAGTVQHEMNLIVTRTPRRLAGWLQYKTTLFEAETARLFVDQFRKILEHVAKRPSARLHEIGELLKATRAERQAAANQRLKQKLSQTFKTRKRRAALVTSGG